MGKCRRKKWDRNDEREKWGFNIDRNWSGWRRKVKDKEGREKDWGCI